MDINMAAWWSFTKSELFFSLTSVTLPALLAIVLMIFGGLAYVLQVKAVKTKPKLKSNFKKKFQVAVVVNIKILFRRLCNNTRNTLSTLQSHQG